MTKTVVDLSDYVRYEPSTGLLYMKVRVKGRKRPHGEPIGTVGKLGYVQVTLMGTQYKAHRVAWFLYYGKWPDQQIDHINGVKDDNRIENLRCGDSVNQHNRSMPTGVSGLTGAHWCERKRKYKSSIRVDGVNKHLGYFRCPTAAHLAYMEEKRKALDV